MRVVELCGRLGLTGIKGGFDFLFERIGRRAECALFVGRRRCNGFDERGHQPVFAAEKLVPQRFEISGCARAVERGAKL